MSDVIMWMLILFFTPFVIYTIFRIVSSAVFKSFFEQKKEFEKKVKEEGNGCKRA